jgi:hypothetical protein
MTQEENHDLLIRIDERVGVLIRHSLSMDKWIANHDKDHQRTKKILGGIAAGVGAVTGFLASFLRR